MPRRYAVSRPRWRGKAPCPCIGDTCIRSRRTKDVLPGWPFWEWQWFTCSSFLYVEPALNHCPYTFLRECFSRDIISWTSLPRKSWFLISILYSLTFNFLLSRKLTWICHKLRAIHKGCTRKASLYTIWRYKRRRIKRRLALNGLVNLRISRNPTFPKISQKL